MCTELEDRSRLKEKKRVIIKIGSSSLTYPDSGQLNLRKLEKLVRIITDLRSQNKDVILVSSGAIAVGVKTCGLKEKPQSISEKQAMAAIGQARLMMTYERLFSEYNQLTAQILMTKDTVVNHLSRFNASNTFRELLKLGVVPIVNENDTVSTIEIEFGDNDRLSAIVASIVEADLLILLTDQDGLYTDDPNKNENAKLIRSIPEITEDIQKMGKSTTGSKVGTGGMHAKIEAARIATYSGIDMVIANGNDVSVIDQILSGEDVGTLFYANKNEHFDLYEYLVSEYDNY